MKLRPEVEEALSEAASDCTDALYCRNADDLEAASLKPALLALVELGVRLAKSIHRGVDLDEIDDWEVEDAIYAQLDPVPCPTTNE